MRKPVEIILRDLDRLTDSAYIHATWAKFEYHSNKHNIETPKKLWFKEKSEEIAQHLLMSTVRIACFKSCPTLLAGYIISLNGVKIWMCVKKDYHNQGIEQLLEKSIQRKPYGKSDSDDNPVRNSDIT